MNTPRERVVKLSEKLGLLFEKRRLRTPDDLSKEPSRVLFYHSEKSYDFWGSSEVWWMGIDEEWKIFHYSDEGVSMLEKEVQQWMESVLPRRKKLHQMFLETHGVLSKTQQRYSVHAGQSITGSGARYDEGVEDTFYLKREELSESEYLFLKEHIQEVPPPEGHFRLLNSETFEVSKVVFPKSKYHLTVVGQTGNSRHGVKPFGVIYSGDPIGYPGGRNVKSKKLLRDGKETNIPYMAGWGTSFVMARLALWENGVDCEHAESLARYYEDNGIYPNKK